MRKRITLQNSKTRFTRKDVNTPSVKYQASDWIYWVYCIGDAPLDTWKMGGGSILKCQAEQQMYSNGTLTLTLGVFRP